MSAEVSAPPIPASTPWAERPGWGISVDLLPGEVRQARRAKVHRQLVALGLVVVLLLCAGVALLTLAQRSTAQQNYEDEQAQTADLKAQEAQYGDVTTARRLLDETAAQTAILMAQDVDVVKLIARIRAALPADMVIGNLAVLMAPPGDPAAAAQSAGGRVVIGSVTISGSGAQIRDVAPFVSYLNGLPGVVDVLPGSTTQTEEGMDFALSFSFTDVLLTHRFDAEAPQ